MGDRCANSMYESMSAKILTLAWLEWSPRPLCEGSLTVGSWKEGSNSSSTEGSEPHPKKDLRLLDDLPREGRPADPKDPLLGEWTRLEATSGKLVPEGSMSTTNTVRSSLICPPWWRMAALAICSTAGQHSPTLQPSSPDLAHTC